MSALRLKTTRWAIASRAVDGSTMFWCSNDYRCTPDLHATRKSAQAECVWQNRSGQNRSWENAGQTFRPVRVSVVITEIKTKKGKK